VPLFFTPGEVAAPREACPLTGDVFDAATLAALDAAKSVRYVLTSPRTYARDCDDDVNCNPDLTCFQRYTIDAKDPGCPASGSDDIGGNDNCYDPRAIAADDADVAYQESSVAWRRLLVRHRRLSLIKFAFDVFTLCGRSFHGYDIYRPYYKYMSYASDDAAALLPALTEEACVERIALCLGMSCSLKTGSP